MSNSVYQLPQLINQLAKDERQLFDRIFNYDVAQSRITVPPGMRAYCERYFGSVEAVEKQKPIKINNKITFDTAIFNQLRARRPQPVISGPLEELIAAERKYDPFANPLEGTSEDIFGRLEGTHCITAANIAKFDTWHSVVIFNEYHPLHFNAEQVVDYLMTAREWAEKVREEDAGARYFFFMWNCLFRAGASIIHGHAQMTVTRQQHYGKIERLRRDAIEYRRLHRRNYFNDLVQVHRALGLTVDVADRVVALASLTPVAEREIWLISDLWSPELAVGLYNALAFYKSVGACAFDVGAYLPPIAPPPAGEDWNEFPVIIRLVERGDPMARSNDIGALNLFAATSLINDPFEVARGLQNWLDKPL
ncbi:MAG TPA: hypothetical protein VH186_02415 [Chloroflexia bacterium]|nr:hypothetical protein [Chloroflexia bacterium]